MKNRFSLSVLLICVLPLLPFLVSSKIYWLIHVIIFFIVLIEYNTFVKSKACTFLWFLGLPLVWGFLMSVNDSLDSIFKAFFYLLTPLVFTVVGMQIAQIASPNKVFKYFVYSGTIGALLYIGLSLYTLGFKALIEPYEVRKLITGGSITNLIAVFIVLFSEKYGVVLYKKKYKIIILLINLLALYLTASRTYYSIFIIFLVVFLYRDNKKIIFIIVGFLYIIFNMYININVDSEFARKISSSVEELQGANFRTDEEVNSKYRGYETFMALKTFNSGTGLNLLLGYGFEKKVDLETFVQLGDDHYREIPILHNGYLFQLLREGILGVMFTLIFLIKVLRIVPTSPVLYFFHLIKVGVILSLLFSNYLENTFFSTEMLQVWLLIGLFLVHEYKERNSGKLRTNIKV